MDMSDGESLAPSLKHLLGNLEAVRDRVSRRCQASQAAAMGLEGVGGEPEAEMMSSDLQKIAAAGIEGLELMAQNKESQVSAAQQLGLEAIVLLEGRPAITVRDGDFGVPPEAWSTLRGEREGIKRSINRVGRIEVQGHPKWSWMGTGFLAGPDVVITNRHVATSFSTKGDAGDWVFKEGRSSSVDFRKEHRSTDSLEFVVTDVIGCHDKFDLAALRVEATGSGGSGLPEPVQLASKPVPDIVGRRVYLVGFPAKDASRNVAPQMERIFADVYDVKRLQPGLANQYKAGDRSMLHDCSTLGGNSGSPVFDLETHTVIGLHFAGRYQKANYAIPFWLLTDDELLRKAGVNFQ
jgi:endonuclease G, mitochondrial